MLADLAAGEGRHVHACSLKIGPASYPPLGRGGPSEPRDERWVVEDRLPGELGGADQAAVVERAGVDRDSRAAAPRAAQRDGLAELVGGGEQQVLVQAAE